MFFFLFNFFFYIHEYTNEISCFSSLGQRAICHRGILVFPISHYLNFYLVLFLVVQNIYKLEFIYIHEYLNKIIRTFNNFDLMCMAQLLFGTKFCKIGQFAASVVVIL